MERLPTGSQGVKYMNALKVIPDNEWGQLKEIATFAFKSKMIPSSIDTFEKAMIIALKGRELGLQPMIAFSHIFVINGKPTLSAEIMLASIYEKYPDAEIMLVESTDNRCVLKAKRPKETAFTEFVWDMARAAQLGLTGKDNWKKQPKTMLWWRCISEMKRAKFPEVLMGISYTREELEDFEKDVTPKATVIPINQESPIKPKSIKNFAPQTEVAPKTIKKEEVLFEEENIEEQEVKTSREEIIAGILSIAKKNKVSMQELGKIRSEFFGKDSEKRELTPEELTIFKAAFEKDLQSKQQ